MRFMTLWRPAETASPPTEKLMSEMNALIAEMTQAGVLISTGGWDPRGPSTIVRRAGGEVTVTDGPFAEAKELIAGYAIIEVASHEEAIRWTRRFLSVAGDGSSEVRALFGPPPTE